ncbi:carboxypeptidase-like regulatory domain-containing protein [Algoriphagus chordae]|nr:carboxypeptidase-like regulatory domain-containing protein [Algoriphagus chordae]
MNLCVSQGMGNIQGSYSYSFPVTTGASITLQLNEDHHFNYAQYGGHNEKTISKGYYFVKQDTLLLFHEGIEHPRPSYFEVISKTDTIRRDFGLESSFGESRVSFKIKVMDYSSETIPHTNVSIMKGKATLSGEVTDENGEARIYTTGREADKVIVSFIGYRNLYIDLEDFWGYITELKVVLSDSDIEYFEKPFLAKYIITKTGELKLLHKDNSDSEIVMVKDTR